eukprot:GHVN01006399.1.p1 GENE.GHVN01006399.1~~GHVN01006399.1.p1  ORF type:complete len:509 (+),score=81.72 GHVN01006399.1:157-1683(+)
MVVCMNRWPGHSSSKLIINTLSFVSVFLPLVCFGDDEFKIGDKPPMGWNSWNAFGCDERFTEGTMREMGDLIVADGFREVGYRYLVLDDCWMLNKRQNGKLIFDPERFPTGHELSEYYHERDLKLGIYSSASEKTCQRYPASLGYEKSDAQSFASWGVDYLKYDNCLTFPYWLTEDSAGYRRRYRKMGAALNATGRPMYYGVSVWGIHSPAKWAQRVAHSWRTTHDILGFWWWIKKITHLNNEWASYSGPGRWNDPDMLEVGNSKLSVDQWKCHFSLWSFIKSPLFIGTDLRQDVGEVRDILLNKEVININQDGLGVQATLRKKVWGEYEVWAGPLENGDQAVMVLSLRIPTSFKQQYVNPLQRISRWWDRFTSLFGLTSFGDRGVDITREDMGLDDPRPSGPSAYQDLAYGAAYGRSKKGKPPPSAVNLTTPYATHKGKKNILYAIRDLWENETIGYVPVSGRVSVRLPAEDCRVFRLVAVDPKQSMVWPSTAPSLVPQATPLAISA